MSLPATFPPAAPRSLMATDEELDRWGDEPALLAPGEPPSAQPMQYWLYWIENGWTIPELARASNMEPSRLRHYLHATAAAVRALAAAREIAAEIADEKAEAEIMKLDDSTDPLFSLNCVRKSEFYQKRARQLAPRVFSERRADSSATATAGVQVILQTFRTQPDGSVVAVPLDAARLVRNFDEDTELETALDRVDAGADAAALSTTDSALAEEFLR